MSNWLKRLSGVTSIKIEYIFFQQKKVQNVAIKQFDLLREWNFRKIITFIFYLFWVSRLKCQIKDKFMCWWHCVSFYIIYIRLWRGTLIIIWFSLLFFAIFWFLYFLVSQYVSCRDIKIEATRVITFSLYFFFFH